MFVNFPDVVDMKPVYKSIYPIDYVVISVGQIRDIFMINWGNKRRIQPNMNFLNNSISLVFKFFYFLKEINVKIL